MSEITHDWVVVPLGKVATTQLGRMLSARRETGTHAKPYLRNRDVQWGHINTEDLPMMDFTPKDSERFLLRPGDVLICEGGEVGRAAIWKGQLSECYYQKAIHRVRPSSDLLPQFLVYLMEHYSRTRAFERYTSGSTISHLPQEDLRNLPIPLPSVTEQRQIVTVIEEQFSRLAAGIATLEQIIANIGVMRSAVLDAEVRAARRAGAAETPLGEIVSPGRKIAYGVLVPGDHDPNGIALIRVGDLKNRRVGSDLKHIAPYIAARFPRTRLEGGEVLLSLVGTIGRTAVVPSELAGATVARALAIIPIRDNIDSRYIAIVLSRPEVTRELNSLSHEVARKTLNLEDVRRYSIPLPDHTIQLKVASKVEAMETWISTAEEMVNRALRRADRLGSSILAAAFSGKLT